jgi:transcription initiation factor TFIID TATA-box-binding protein
MASTSLAGRGLTRQTYTLRDRLIVFLLALAETFEERDEINSITYEPAENHWLQTRFAPDDTYLPFYQSVKCSIV